MLIAKSESVFHTLQAVRKVREFLTIFFCAGCKTLSSVAGVKHERVWHCQTLGLLAFLKTNHNRLVPDRAMVLLKNILGKELVLVERVYVQNLF